MVRHCCELLAENRSVLNIREVIPTEMYDASTKESMHWCVAEIKLRGLGDVDFVLGKAPCADWKLELYTGH